jgi:hypothetical protein
VVHAAAAFVGFAPVGWVGYEVEDCWGGVGEGCFGGYAVRICPWFLVERVSVWDVGRLRERWIVPSFVCQCIDLQYIGALTRDDGNYDFMAKWLSG